MARSLIHPLMAVVLSPAPSLHLLPQRPPSFQRIRWRGTDVCYLSATFTHLAWSPAFNGYYSIKDLGTPSFNYRDGRDPRCVCVRACVRACLFMHVCMCLCACACVCVRACAAIILHVRKTCSLMDAVRLICLPPPPFFLFCFVLEKPCRHFRWSTWVESTWDPIKARMFLIESPESQVGAGVYVCLGCV